MDNIVYLNGEFMEKNEAKISIFDRGFILGDGIYEVIPIVNSKLIDKQGFWERFERSLAQINLPLPMPKVEYFNMLNELILKNKIIEGGVYTQVTRGVAPREFYFIKDLKPTCMAYAYKKEIINNPFAKIGIKIASTEDLRWKRRDIKSISLLAQCMAKDDIHDKGAFEGFMVENGFVTEGVSSTAYIVKDNKVITTPLTRAILSGVRRKNLITILKNENIEFIERQFTIAEAKEADEVFISAATLIIMPVVEIDGEKIGNGKPGSLSLKLREKYIENILKEAREI